MMKSLYPARLMILLLASLGMIPWQAVGQQATINISPQQLPDFREVYTGLNSDVQFYTVSAEDLTGSLEISAPSPFQISMDCKTDFVSSLTLSPAQGNVEATRIYVRMAPHTTGNWQENISHQASGVEVVNLQVSGTAVETLVPENYYQSATATGSQLKTQLHQIIDNHQVQSYSSLWTHFRSTDPTFSGAVWDIYSDLPCQDPPYVFTFGEDQDTGSGGSQEGQYYNREHTMPRSWFGGSVSPMNTDLVHIYPTDKLVNAKRGSEPYGMVNNPSWTSLNGSKLGANTAGDYSGTAFEPIDEYKGDLARVYFYMVTRYEDQISTWTYNAGGNAMLDHNKYPGYEPWVIDMLTAWHEQDPVSQKEILRNHAIYQIQGNRNPFVDHPEFVEQIWSNPNVGTDPLLTDPLFRIFPNPATSMVQVESSLRIIKLEVLSLKGRKMLEFTPQATSARFSVSHLAPGMYFIAVQTHQGKTIKKIVKY